MKKSLLGYCFVALSAISGGGIIFGGQLFLNHGVSLFELLLFPYVLILFVLIPLIFFYKEKPVKRNELPLLALYALLNAGITLAQFLALVFGASVSITVLLIYTQPLWTVIFSKIFLKEKVTLRHIIACILIILGVGFLVNIFRVSEFGSLFGMLIALAGGIFISGTYVVGGILSKKNVPPFSMNYFGVLFMLVLWLILFPIIKIFIPSPNISSFSFIFSPLMWLYFLLFAGILIGWYSFYLIGVKRIPVITAGIICLLEPIVAVILSVIFLGEMLTLSTIIGAGLILLANYLAITGSMAWERSN